jgi:hypothetical protein
MEVDVSVQGLRRIMCDQLLRLGGLLLVAGTLGCFAAPTHAGHADQSAQGEQLTESMDMDHHQHSVDAIDAMTPHLQHSGPHMRWTSLRPANADDRQRGEEIVQSLRNALTKYQDYRVALNDGYAPVHPERKAPHYHFANKQQKMMARKHFDAAAPSALLYTKNGDGYELEGAMYTAPRGMTEDQLNERVPLSVAQWHAHINVCFPPDGNVLRGSRRQFGFKGSIDTESACQQAGGRFVPQVGGWMIHVYPFKATPAEIWTH